MMFDLSPFGSLTSTCGIDEKLSKMVGRPESIMLQNLPILCFLHGISLIFCLLCLFLCFLDMHYADN